jgi:hypothetical protein
MVGFSSDLEYELREPDEDIEVLRWRRRRLRDLGFAEDEIRCLIEARADWHEAERLLLQGCPHHLIVRLLT